MHEGLLESSRATVPIKKGRRRQFRRFALNFFSVVHSWSSFCLGTTHTMFYRGRWLFFKLLALRVFVNQSFRLLMVEGFWGLERRKRWVVSLFAINRGWLRIIEISRKEEVQLASHWNSDKEDESEGGKRPWKYE